VREGSILGDRVILQPGAVIGSDGFGFAPDGEKYYKIPQLGHVVLEDDVEIGANTCVDRGTMGTTVIEHGTKLDNLVQIGHNVRVGANTVMAAQVGIAGSCKVGRHCTFGGQSAMAGHIQTGDNLTVGARGALAGNTEGNQIVSGAPAFAHREWLKASMSFPHLPHMRRELTELRQRIEQLEAELAKE
jgi:UDP-3-O-[3-hydroxymyristoyl] glucosamine N-acyltransferase